ncbi:MAG TPA: winged helix DNA-binding domain-containing protein [Candidatus Limnocylindria bacterium]|nr:winged helix DNA-binding domain-containing protein [Candidatus Limnocylindria bacterium]
MRLTARQLNRATLQRQLLVQRQKLGVEGAVAALCGLQAQSPASPYIALWNRVRRFRADELDRAIAEHRIVKATLIRLTLHAVAVDDYPVFYRAMVDDMRRARVFDRRFTDAGVSAADAEALLPELLAYASGGRANAEFEAYINERGLSGTHIWFALRRYGPFWHAPTNGPWQFSDRPAYMGALTAPFDGERPPAVAVLLRRYLAAFGPASTADFNQFSWIPQPPIKEALAVLGEELVTHEGPDGKPLFDVAGATVPPEDTAAPPRLLPMFDNVLLAYRDRSRITPEPYRKVISRMNGDTLPAVLVDGRVAGVWRPAPEGDAGIEITAFERLDKATWTALDGEAHDLVAFLADRQPDVYRRYAHWWARQLPSEEVRVL